MPVKCNKSDYEYLMQCNKYSAQIWNACVKSDKEHNKITGKYLTRSELQFMMKKSVPIILANSINFVILKYITARDAMFRSIKANHQNSKKVKLPYKEKKYFNTGYTYQNIRIDKEKHLITLARPLIIVDGKQTLQPRIKCHVKTIPDNIKEIELVYKNGLKLAIKYIEEDNKQLIQSENEAAIDLGEIHSITSIDNHGNGIIITGRKIRAIKQLRNKELAKLKSKRSKCPNDSRQYKRYSKAIYNLKYSTDKKVLDCIHKTTKLYLDYCLQNNIGTVYYGDLDSVSRGTKQKEHGNKFVRQKLSQWCFGLLTSQLNNKLSRYGIKFIKVKEYYTSQKCPACKKRNKPNGRNYKCKCGYKMHRDINGAINILNDNSKKYKIKECNTLKYLRIA